ncbi:hypothetical protein [Streptomyces tremellae]
MPPNPDPDEDESDPELAAVVRLAWANGLSKDEDLPPATREEAARIAGEAADELKRNR